MSIRRVSTPPAPPSPKPDRREEPPKPVVSPRDTASGFDAFEPVAPPFVKILPYSN